MKQTFLLLALLLFAIPLFGQSTTSKPKETEYKEKKGKEKLIDILGKELEDKNGNKVPTTQAFSRRKLTGIYFSAHWCGPCCRFTPILVNFYTKKIGRKPFQIIFVSLDHSAQEMKNYKKETKMPWLAIPYDSPARITIKEKFGVKSIPTLIILNEEGYVITTNGRGDVVNKGRDAYDYWKNLGVVSSSDDDIYVVPKGARKKAARKAAVKASKSKR